MTDNDLELFHFKSGTIFAFCNKYRAWSTKLQDERKFINEKNISSVDRLNFHGRMFC